MFSLPLDESSDIAVQQILVIVVRYFHEHAVKTVDSLLDVASGQGLHNAVKKLLQERNIPRILYYWVCKWWLCNDWSKKRFPSELEDVPSVFVIYVILLHFVQSTTFLVGNVHKNVCSCFSRNSKLVSISPAFVFDVYFAKNDDLNTGRDFQYSGCIKPTGQFQMNIVAYS